MSSIKDKDHSLPDASAWKGKLQSSALAVVQEKMDDLNSQLAALQEASRSETKSSAGDKYETGRESINQSRNMLEKQWVLVKQWDGLLRKIGNKPQTEVCEGALIELNLGWIWVAVSLGKLELEGREIQLVSVNSPLIQSLIGKKRGDMSNFRGQEIKILDVW